MKVQCAVNLYDEDPEGEHRGAGVRVSCTRCGASETSRGTSERSIRRCFALLKENCKRGETNFYFADEVPPPSPSPLAPTPPPVDASPVVVRVNKFAIVHFATTGLKRDSEIVQIAVATVDHDRPGWQLTTNVQPKGEIDAGASKVHGLYAHDLSNAPFFGEVAETLLHVLSGRIVLCISKDRFFSPVLRHALESYGFDAANLPAASLDVAAIARTLDATGHDFSLAALLERHRLPALAAHATTLERVRAIWALFYTLAEKYPMLGDATTLEALVDLELAAATVKRFS